MGVADHGTAGQTTAAPSLAEWAGSVAAALDESDVPVDERIAAHAGDTTGVHGIADTAALVVTTDPRMSDARTPTAHTHPAAQISDSSTVGRAVLTATDTAAARAAIGAAQAGATSAADLSAPYTRIRSFVRALRNATQCRAILIQGDSTGNGTDEWFHLAMQWLAQQFPALTVTHRLWDDGTQLYGEPTVLQTGTSVPGGLVTTASGTDYYFTIPDSAATSPAGDLDVRVRLTLPASGAQGPLAAKFGASGQRSWRIEINPTGRSLMMGWSADGSTLVDRFIGYGSSGLAALAGQPVWIRLTLDVDNGAGGHTVTAYYSSDAEPTSWAMIGSPSVNAGTTAIFDASGTTQFNGRGGVPAGLVATFHALRVYASLTGANRIIDIDLAAWREGVTSFTDFCGNTITVTGSTGSATGGALLVLNASTAGQVVTYSSDATRFPKQALLPNADLAFISYSHNEGSISYRAAYKALVDALVARWPDIGVIPVAQNPRSSPQSAASIRNHAIRLQQVSELAATMRLPLLDAFQSITDAGSIGDYVAADGIHPTAAGTALWVETARNLFAPWI